MRDKFKKPRRRAPARRRRATTKRPNRRGQTSITTVRGSVMPDKMIVKLPYIDYQKINAAGGQATPNYFQKTYSLNALYDPEPGALNTYPLGYDEWSQLYQRYRVFAASYELTLWNGSDDTSVIGALYINDAGGTGGMNANVTSWLAQPRARPISLGNKSGGKSQQVFRGKVYCPGYLGMTSEQYRTDAYGTSGFMGSAGVVPVRNLKMFINLTNTNAGVTTANVYASIKITYHAELFDRTSLVTAINTTDGDQADGGEEAIFPAP